MALNYDGQFSKDGYFGQAKIIQEYINQTHAKKVLELASGKGFNSTYLAKQNPDVEFIGIDLTPEHVKFANENAQGISNLKFEQGNFQDLQFPDDSFDLVFEVESVCHATDMKKALSESRRVLKSQGFFIVIDGFRSPDFDSFSEDLKTAAKLAEISMAVEKGWKINEWTSLCETVGLKVEKMDDLSMAIMPNLSRFQFLARGFFKFPSISRTILKAMPYYLVQNAIAGIFMPFTIGAGMQKYYMVALTPQ
jgi:ubiquinone/menaquinone biosynthesis C-methylase UbiE